jgi:phage minor structural protein
MTIYLFDNSKNLIGSVRETIDYTQKSVLGGTITATVTAVYAQDIESAHYFGSKDIDDENTFCMYRVTSISKQGGLITLSGIHIMFDELQGEVIRDIRPQNVSAPIALSRILEGSMWQMGISQATGIAGTTFYYQSRLSAFWDFSKRWSVEFKPRLVFASGQITGRYIDIYDSISDDYGKWYEYGDKLIDVVAEQANEGIYTALVGLGKGEEVGDGFGRKINFSDVVWEEANGDPVDKPTGQDYVSLLSAVAMYGHRESVIDFPDIEDKEELLQATYNELLYRSRPKVEFKANAIETDMVELGETVTIVRDDIGIRYKTRVFELERNFLDKTVKSFRFGDRISMTGSERIKQEQGKTAGKIKEQESLLVATRNQSIVGYWNEDGYDYALKADNIYNLPAGYYSFDRPIDENPTKAIYIGAGKILIADRKLPNGQWDWHTAGTGSGLVADAITTGKLMGDNFELNLSTGILSFGERVNGILAPVLQFTSTGQIIYGEEVNLEQTATSMRYYNKITGKTIAEFTSAYAKMPVAYVENLLLVGKTRQIPLDEEHACMWVIND